MADEQESQEFNMDAAVDEISSGLGLDAKEESEIAEDEPEKVDEPAKIDEPAKDVPEKRVMPKSWAKEQQEVWDEMTPRAQAQYELREKQMLDGLEQYKGDSGFGKQMREVMTPYKAMLQSQGVDEPKAVQYLLNAHYRLSNSNPTEKASYFSSLAKSYGIDLTTLQPASDAPQIDPAVKALQDQVNTLQSSMTQKEQAAMNEAKSKVAGEVEAFASDPKNQYFDECADDIAALIQAGNTLQDAYEKAVYANPVTRAKELARLQTENEKTFREKSKADAEAARKAAGTNVRSRDTRKAPTEPKGTMEDTMRATLKEIRERVH